MTGLHRGLAALVFVVLGCSNADPAQDSGGGTKAAAGESLEKVTDLGPVTATITLTPKEPRIGDVLTLSLQVEHEPGVRVTMPPFGEVLGRFTVVKFKPEKARPSADGKRTTVRQTYTLQAGASGRQRVPQLRIEYQPADASEPLELLTEELSISIESVVTSTEIGSELGRAPAPLDERPGVPMWIWPALGGALGAAALIALVLLRSRRRADELRTQLGAYDRALSRLRALMAAPLPSADDADGFYVEMSSIVRQYIEDRMHLRAPELTTEEFLAHAQSERDLDDAVRTHLSEFLSSCDRVKFAAYAPSPRKPRRPSLSPSRF